MRERTSDGAAGPAVGNGSGVDEVKNCGEAKDVKEEAPLLVVRPLRAATANPAAPRGRRRAGKMDIDRREQSSLEWKLKTMSRTKGGEMKSRPNFPQLPGTSSELSPPSE